jgi:hypothetical protein
MTRVSVAPTGPPLVMSQMSSNLRSDQMVMSRARSPTAGLMTCQVTARKVHHRPAPSTLAASVRSWGTACSADSSTTEVNGNSCQMVVTRMAGSAYRGLSRMEPPGTPSPIAFRKRFTMPYWELSIHVAISATAIPGAAHGTVISARATPRPRKPVLSRSAMTSPEPTAPTTQATT